MVVYLESLANAARASYSKVLVIGSHQRVTAELANSASMLGLGDLTHLLTRLEPRSDSGVSGGSVVGGVEVVVGLLPTACSRHNSPAQPHAIRDLVKTHYTENLLVVLLVASADDIYAAGCAVARAQPTYNNKTPVKPAFNLQVAFHPMKPSENILSQLHHAAKGIQLAAALVDMPPNELHSDAFVAKAQKMTEDLQSFGVTLEVTQGAELEKQGFGGLFGVGKAATHQPALVVLKYQPKTDEKMQPIVMVGKGIIYDTGGLSIKMKDFMPGMKRDMGGAAGIFGAFEAIVRSSCSSSVKRPVYAILCLAENSVGPIATRPDDVHVMYSGKTVEINNTDAEGRLVLADGVAYAVKHLDPHVIIDMATLTGAQGVATGRNVGAIYCNNEALEQTAVSVGRQSGDLVHPLPYVPEFYRKEFKSAVADMKNSVKDRANAGSACAGQFIGNHLGVYEANGLWLHIDMAYPSFTNCDERATGFGVALLQQLVLRLAE